AVTAARPRAEGEADDARDDRVEASTEAPRPLRGDVEVLEVGRRDRLAHLRPGGPVLGDLQDDVAPEVALDGVDEGPVPSHGRDVDRGTRAVGGGHRDGDE